MQPFATCIKRLQIPIDNVGSSADDLNCPNSSDVLFNAGDVIVATAGWGSGAAVARYRARQCHVPQHSAALDEAEFTWE